MAIFPKYGKVELQEGEPFEVGTLLAWENEVIVIVEKSNRVYTTCKFFLDGESRRETTVFLRKAMSPIGRTPSLRFL